MKRVVLADTHSAAGTLKAARIADWGDAAGWDLIERPAPAANDVVAFFRERHRLLAARTDTEYAVHGDGESGARFLAFLDQAATFDRLELWFSPQIGSQLGLCLAINEIANRPALAARTVIIPLSVRLAEQTPDWVRALVPGFLPITPATTGLASESWRAFCSPTPEAWLALTGNDMSALPQLGFEAGRWMTELPDGRTGLSASQMLLLDQIAREPAQLRDVFALLVGEGASLVDYWRLGEILVDLFAAPTPAATGINERSFTLSTHDDEARRHAFMSAKVRLTPFGEELVKGRTDWAAANPIDRWWGGTHLTNHSLWRWDPEAKRLMPPR